MTEVTEPSKFAFNESEAKLIKMYMKDGISRVNIARTLRNELEDRKIIDETTTYDELVENKPIAIYSCDIFT